MRTWKLFVIPGGLFRWTGELQCYKMITWCQCHTFSKTEVWIVETAGKMSVFIKLSDLFHRRFGHHLFDVIEPLWTTIGIWILGLSTIPTILQIMNLLRTQNHLLQSFNPFFILKHFKVNIALWYNINAMHSFITMRENVNTFDNFNSPSSCSLLEDVAWFIRNWSERNPSVSLKSDSLRSN